MKFLVFSDSHAYTNGMDEAISSHKDIRHIIHCGDVLADVEYLQHVYGRTHAIASVCGNNDYAISEPLFRIIPVEGHKIYVTHGHRERVKSSLYALKGQAKTNNCDICIFGHTHTQLYEIQDGFTILNPGSIGYFRQEYAVLDVNKDNVNVSLYKL